MKNVLSMFIVFVCALSLVSPVLISAENRFVRLNLEIDKKRVQEKFNLLLYVNKVEIEPLRFDNGFVVPEELGKYEKVDVRVVFRNYELLFEAVPASAFGLDWIVGVDLKPFDQENIDPAAAPPPGRKLVFIYFIHYVARTTRHSDTRNVIRVYK